MITPNISLEILIGILDTVGLHFQYLFPSFSIPISWCARPFFFCSTTSQAESRKSPTLFLLFKSLLRTSRTSQCHGSIECVHCLIVAYNMWVFSTLLFNCQWWLNLWSTWSSLPINLTWTCSWGSLRSVAAVACTTFPYSILFIHIQAASWSPVGSPSFT
jgi:hypothetical protein